MRKKGECVVREKCETVVGTVIRKDELGDMEEIGKGVRILRVRNEGRHMVLRRTHVPPRGGASTALQEPPKPRQLVLDKTHFQVSTLDPLLSTHRFFFCPHASLRVHTPPSPKS